MNYTKNFLYPIGSILSFVFIGLIIYNLRSTVVKGYEVDIYSNLEYDWILMTIVYIFGSLVLLSTSLSKGNYYDRKYFFVAFTILLFLNSIILLIPKIKYDVLWDRWDSWYHIGHVQDILNTGHIDTYQNPYPGLHILGSFLTYILGISKIEYFFILTNPLLYSLYPIFMYLLGNKLGLNDIQKASVICFSVLFPYIAVSQTAVPTGFAETSPFNFATFFMPIVMILVFNKNTNRLLALVFIFMVTISHMVTAISMAIGFLSMKIFQPVKRISIGIKNNIKNNINKFIFYVSIISIMSWLMYLTDMYIWPTKTIFNVIFNGQVFPATYGEVMNNAGVTGFNKVILLSKILTPSFIVIVLSLIAIKRILNKNEKNTNLFVLLGWFVSNSILFIIITTLLSNLGFSSFRLLGLEFILVPIMAGYTFGMEFKKNLTKKINLLALICILLIFFATGLFTKYPSPYVDSINWQATQQDISGISWTGTFKNESIAYVGGNYNQAILAGFVGYDRMMHRNDFRHFDVEMPKHLGYDNNTEYQKMVNNYILLTKFDFYLYSRIGEMSNSDLVMIEEDKSFNKAYDGGEYKVYSPKD